MSWTRPVSSPITATSRNSVAWLFHRSNPTSQQSRLMDVTNLKPKTTPKFLWPFHLCLFEFQDKTSFGRVFGQTQLHYVKERLRITFTLHIKWISFKLHFYTLGIELTSVSFSSSIKGSPSTSNVCLRIIRSICPSGMSQMTSHN